MTQSDCVDERSTDSHQARSPQTEALVSGARVYTDTGLEVAAAAAIAADTDPAVAAESVWKTAHA